MEVEVEAKANGEDCLNQVRGFSPPPARRAPALWAGAVTGAAVTTGQHRARRPRGSPGSPPPSRRGGARAPGEGRRWRGAGPCGGGRGGGGGERRSLPVSLTVFVSYFYFPVFSFFLFPNPFSVLNAEGAASHATGFPAPLPWEAQARASPLNPAGSVPGRGQEWGHRRGM